MSDIRTKAKKLQLEIFEKLSTLVTAGLGLVAALAWNSFIQNIFREIFGTYSSLWAQGGYAVLVTVIVVVLTIQISRAVNRLKEELKVESEEQIPE
jgi:hypothetical protein